MGFQAARGMFVMFQTGGWSYRLILLPDLKGCGERGTNVCERRGAGLSCREGLGGV